MKKAAVVIGVNRPARLPPLASAAAGAERVGQWLEGEGFDVRCLTDKAGPVTSAQAEEALQAFVSIPPRYHLLVVYFSGHGYWHAGGETWLLSGAPVRPGEAVNVDSAMELAKYSGIPNVVFISDACRSIPTTRGGHRLTPNGLFPNFDEVSTPSKIDSFKATAEALPAYEAAINGQPQSVLTAALLSAYAEPDAHMVREVFDGQETIQIIPNRRLEDYLQRKVDALLASTKALLTQRIEANVPSSDDVYLGRVRPRPSVPASAPAPAPAEATPPRRAGAAAGPRKPPPLDPGREAGGIVTRVLTTRGFGQGLARPKFELASSLTEQAVRLRLPRPGNPVGADTGFVLRSAAVAEVVVPERGGGIGVKVVAAGDGHEQPALIRIDAAQPVSVAIRLADDRVVVLAALPQFIGHAVFDDTGLTHVSYLPARPPGKIVDHLRHRLDLDPFRAVVALAARERTLRVHSPREAQALAEQIRGARGLDPALALYAARAYSDAGYEEQLGEVLAALREQLQADLFDLRLFASRSALAQESRVPVVPLCPLLTQTWHRLKPRRVQLSAELEEAADALADSLWTTFQPQAAALVLRAIRNSPSS